MEISTHTIPNENLQSESPNKPLNENKPKFKIENITVTRPTLLKIFYWESLDVESLNQKILFNENYIEHHLELPLRQLNSNSLKIVFWLRNLSNFEYVVRLKRLQNCQCLPKETRVGFNQYRHLYHCPHRRLININQDLFVMKSNELTALTLVSYYYILGRYTLSYELSIADSRIILLNFHINISSFDVEKSVLTTKMIPVNMKEYRFLSQPVWIRNITTQNVPLFFTAKSHNLRVLNRSITIPPQSVWPLIVQYRPSDFENNVFFSLNLEVRYGHRTSVKYQIPITCRGFIEEQNEKYNVPILDYECSEFLYVIYPNRLEFITEINEERTLMVAVHNFNQQCMEFKWQTYAINGYFIFTFEPNQFTLKPHHSKLCVVRAKTFKIPLHFKRIPAILEIHCIQDKSIQIAKQLFTEIESIDDPKWAENSYVSHVFLHLDLKVEFPKEQRIIVKASEITENLSDKPIVFESLFWDYLSKTNYMRSTSKILRNLTYKQVLNQATSIDKKKPHKLMDKQEALNTLSFLTGEACRDLAKNYRFVPREILDPI